jgi:hypothetical protein
MKIVATAGIVIAFAGLFLSTSFAQLQSANPYKPIAELPPAPKAAHINITERPELESATSNSAIIRWTSDNPGGSDEHFGVVMYGTDPTKLTETAKSHIRLNRNHSYTVFRVRLDNLKSETTYYYKVESMPATGERDGVKSPLSKFRTP